MVYYQEKQNSTCVHSQVQLVITGVLEDGSTFISCQLSNRVRLRWAQESFHDVAETDVSESLGEFFVAHFIYEK